MCVSPVSVCMNISCFVQLLQLCEVPLCLISPPAVKQLARQLLGQASRCWHSVGFHFICQRKSDVRKRKAENFQRVGWTGKRNTSRCCIFQTNSAVVIRFLIWFLKMWQKLNIDYRRQVIILNIHNGAWTLERILKYWLLLKVGGWLIKCHLHLFPV